MTYLAVIQGGDWALSRESLVEALRRRWPEASVEFGDRGPDADPVTDVVWTMGSGSALFEGSAHASGQCIYLDGENPDVASVASWYRSLIPPDEEVVFCDDTYSFDMVLEPGASAEEILELLTEE
jgi:hypothetical protein